MRADKKHMIDMQALSVGMFIHLDIGWMSHPFPLNSFKITDSGQIATLRSLGLRQLRWSPQLSDMAAPGGSNGDGGPDEPSMGVDTVAARAATATHITDTTDAVTEPLASPEPAAPVAPPPPPPHCQQLAQQDEALALCERQFAQMARDWRDLIGRVSHEPLAARAAAEALTQALTDKLLVDGDLCIRLLCDAAGDKASLHVVNVTVIALLLGRTLGLAASDMLDLGVGAMFHDVGKTDMAQRVRHVEASHSSAEVRLYEEHVARGVLMARTMGLSHGAQRVIAQHHEHADGSGFPLRLKTDGMTLAARIVALVNRYDNLCNPQFPAQALTPHEALSLLFTQSKTRFDTTTLGAFIRMMGVYPAGSAVQLTDDRYAIVVGVNSSRPLRPRVVVHDPDVPRTQALICDLEHQHGLGIRRSVKPQQLPAAALAYLAPRPRVAYFFEPHDAPNVCSPEAEC